MSTKILPMTARQGRANQKYTPDGYRIVAGCVVMPADRSQILLISSEANPQKWILPKGGAETDETIEQSAERETWEESGAIGELGKLIGTFKDTTPHRKTLFYIYEMVITELSNDWPEKHKRRRQWMNFRTAHDALVSANRPQLLEAVIKSSLNR